MKRLLLIFAGVVAAAGSGCAMHQKCDTGCPPGGSANLCDALGGRGRRGGNFDDYAGPATATVTYPYYTTRGPRDFLAKCPPPLGP